MELTQEMIEASNDSVARRALARRSSSPATYEMNGHKLSYKDLVTCETCAVSATISAAVMFAWFHQIRVLTVDGTTIRWMS